MVASTPSPARTTSPPRTTSTSGLFKSGLSGRMQGTQLMPNPLFTVVVPTFRRPESLPKSIVSILTQTIGDLECIVVNDDSEPLPPEVGLGDDRVRIIERRANGGPSAARNAGLAAARGRYLSFLDDDDVYL